MTDNEHRVGYQAHGEQDTDATVIMIAILAALGLIGVATLAWIFLPVAGG